MSSTIDYDSCQYKSISNLMNPITKCIYNLRWAIREWGDF